MEELNINAFNEFAILLSLCVIVGFVAVKIRQPLIFSFIIVGIFAGQNFLNKISSLHEIEVLASFGITLLLFIVGLKLDLERIKLLGIVPFFLGLSQIICTTLLGFLVLISLQFTVLESLFAALCFSFSSTIIIIKILSDRYEIDSLYGQISIGILLTQDFVVIVAIILFSSLSAYQTNHIGLHQILLEFILKSIGFFLSILLLMNFILPRFVEQIAKSKELLILFSLAWAVILAVLAESLGFSKEVGGFLAGVSLANNKFRESIASRLETVRNLLLLFFFLNLGASISIQAFHSSYTTIVLMTGFVLIIKPLIVICIMAFLRFKQRTSFLTSLTLSQVSEFSLILSALGVKIGLISKELEGIIIFVCLISIGISTYLMAYANQLYLLLSPYLPWRNAKITYRETTLDAQKDIYFDVIIYGVGRHGENIANDLEKQNLNILGVDFDPHKVKSWRHRHILVHYGDAEDTEFPQSLPLKNVKWVISTVPNVDANKALIYALKENHYKGKIALSAYNESSFHILKKLKADIIFQPYKDAAAQAAERILKAIQNANAYAQKK